MLTIIKGSYRHASRTCTNRLHLSQQAKKEVRKLFVNCCRVHPEPCLQLISMALSALNQPLSTGNTHKYHCNVADTPTLARYAVSSAVLTTVSIPIFSSHAIECRVYYFFLFFLSVYELTL
jgi:hypothetical protein